MFKKLLNLFTHDIAIDLGTANTLVYLKGQGVKANEPSVVAVSRDLKGNRRVLAVGQEAKEMLGRTPGRIEAIRPMKDGVIADFEIAEVMITEFIKKVNKYSSFLKPKVVIAVPYGITEVEKRAVREAVINTGCSEVFLVEEPMAAAIGAGLPIDKPGGNMVVDIGGGTTEVAVISLYGIVYSKSVRIGGDKLDDTIISYLKKKYNLLIGERTAEQVKMGIGSAFRHPDDDGAAPKVMDVKGRNMTAGIPETVRITEEEIREAMREPIREIVDAVLISLERTPPELAADIIERGISLTGGGALIKNLDYLLMEETGLPVYIAENPLLSVVNGAGKLLEDENLLMQVAH